MSERPNLADLPVRADRRTAAALLTRFYFPASARTLEAWPLPWQIVNGKAVVLVTDLFALAEEKLAAAPVVRGGRRANAGGLGKKPLSSTEDAPAVAA
jgi:hypothetical protein